MTQKISAGLLFGVMLSVVTLVWSASSASAASGNISKTLKRGSSYSVKTDKRCSLTVLTETTSKIVIRCSGSAARTTTSASAILKKGKTATFKAQSCYLRVTKKSKARVAVNCGATRPTATPTPTSTFTPTATPTATSTPTATPTPTPNAHAIAANNSLISFNTSSPSTTASIASLTGVAAGQEIVSIDRRPANGGLYGLGYNSTTGEVQLYHISTRSALASSVGSTGSFVDGSSNPERIGVDAQTKIGIDFNPTVDRLRVVTTSSQNFRINPNTGAFVDGNVGLSGTNTDSPINGGTTSVGEAAYTNNSLNQSVTTIYTIDASTNALYIQNPANNGTQTNSIGLTYNNSALDIIEARGFDILAGVNVATSNSAVSSGSAYGVLEFASNSQQLLCQVDLTNGAVTNESAIGAGNNEILGLALKNTATNFYALNSTNQLMRFTSDAPGTVTTVTTSGVTAGETLVGLDFRPTTGELFSLGVNATADTATLYRLDPQTGAATAIGSAVSISNLPDISSGYGFNFNPTVDRIRVVTGTGLNFRLNPTTGAVTAIDSALNGSASAAVGAAYTNAYAGASATTLYDLDYINNKLMIQNPPNGGVLADVATIPLDFEASLGFDIPSDVETTSSGTGVVSGLGYAAFTVGSTTSLYSLNLVTGAVTNLGTIGAGATPVVSLAVGE